MSCNKIMTFKTLDNKQVKFCDIPYLKFALNNTKLGIAYTKLEEKVPLITDPHFEYYDF